MRCGEAAAEHYPWIPVVYRQTSGFVHLSGRHITASVTKTGGTGVLEMQVGPGRTWGEQDVLEAVDAFREATLALMHLCWSWLQTEPARILRRPSRVERERILPQ